jgi:tRNA pseudouridine55 synthase
MDGLIILDKPAGITSARAVAVAKRLLGRAKVGHAGTLDPFATGLLILLVGRATRSCEQIMGLPKTYEATIKLGATTATDDIESPETPGEISSQVSRERIEQTLNRFVGLIDQRPPVYSAIKLQGRRACDRVRAGAQIELKPRKVRIDSIELLHYTWPSLSVRIICGRGTYIRAIARDLGADLGCGGYLTALRRTKIGQFSVDQAVKLDQLTKENAPEHVRMAALSY